jgi:glycosyltransferase involved in cell wall biosynthesis
MPEPANPFVSVVIPHYNDLENLTGCLASLRRQTWPRERFEIIVADNNSGGGVAAVQRLAGDVIVVPALEQGAGPARNAGAAAAHGSVLAFIDSDCIAGENWLAGGVSALSQFDYVGGQVVTRTGPPRQVTAAEAVEAVFAFNFKKYIEKDRFSGTGNLFVPRAVFERVGGFRAGVSEDIDWCRRANAIGLSLGYAESAIVFHAARRDWGELRRKWDRVLEETIRLARERPGWRLRWLGYAAAVAASPLAHSFRVLCSPRLTGVRARCYGLLGLLCVRGYRSWRMLCLLVRPPG